MYNEIFFLTPFLKATELTGGIHALRQSNSVLTYLNQFKVKDDPNLSPEQAYQACLSFPDFWEVEYFHIKTPSDFVPSQLFPAPS